jgi:hypothetical protein
MDMKLISKMLAAALAELLPRMRRKKSRTMPCLFAAGLTLVMLAATPPVQAEILEGHIVRSCIILDNLHGPPNEFIFDSVVGPGTEITSRMGFFHLDIDLSDTNILITSSEDWVTGLYGTPTVRFTDAYGTIPRFTGLTLNPATNWPGSIFYSFEPNWIRVSFASFPGAHVRQGDQVSLDITAIIPEPATWLLAAVATSFLAPRRKRSHRMPCKLVAAFALVLFAATESVQAETLDGHIVRTEYTEAQPHGESISIIRDTVVGPGTEITDGVRGFQFDFSDTNILITNTIDQVLTSWAETGSFIITDAYGTIPRFTGVTVNPATTWPGSIPNYIHFSPNSIVFGLQQGLHVTEGAQLSLDITAIIPEPGTAGLLLVGVAFMVVRRGRIRNRKELS